PVVRLLLHVDPLDRPALPLRSADGARVEADAAGGARVRDGARHGDSRAGERGNSPGLVGFYRGVARPERRAPGGDLRIPRPRPIDQPRVLTTGPPRSREASQDHRRTGARDASWRGELMTIGVKVLERPSEETS